MACRLKEERELFLSPDTNVMKPEAKDIQGGCSVMMGRSRIIRDNLWGTRFAKSRERVLLFNLLHSPRDSTALIPVYCKENGLLL